MKNPVTPQQTILIVDDDQNVLEVLNARLTSQGFHVIQASGANEALNVIENESIDLMISDIKMPGMGGLDLFSVVRSREPSLPVIFLTAYGTISEAVRAVTEYAFTHHDLIRIYAYVFETNLASVRVLEKAGYIFEARLRKHVFKDNKIQDVMIYAILKDS